MKIVILASDRQPIYEQIAGQIKKAILCGELVQQDSLPSIRNLAKDLQVSVITTRRAYEELEKDGFIETIPGKGCFVAAGNRETLQKRLQKSIAEHLTEAVSLAKKAGYNAPQLKILLEEIWEAPYDECH